MKTISTMLAALSLFSTGAFAADFTHVNITGVKAKELIQALELAALVPARHDDNTFFRNYIVSDVHCHGSTAGPNDDGFARATCELYVAKGSKTDLLAGNAAASVLFGNIFEDLDISYGTGMSHFEGRIQNVRCRINLAESAPATYVCAYRLLSE